jgi:endogenous inhibitor of DNA gyrase (YacG/DUF329 family)
MKEEYIIKKTCPHCGYSFEFKNTSEKVRRKATGYTNEQMANILNMECSGKNKDNFHQTGWDYFYPCPNCDYQIKWHHTPMEEDKHGNGNN